MENDLERALDVLPQEEEAQSQDVVTSKDWDRRDHGKDTSRRSLSRSQDEPYFQSIESYERKDSTIDARDRGQDTDRNLVPLKRVVTAQNWTGPDDPENPHNWRLWKRIYNTAATGLLAFIV